MAFTKGDILLPSNKVAKKDWLNGLFHPAVVWDDNYDGNTDFRGIMLTHSPPNGNFVNILMANYHFEPGHTVTFSKTHFVNQVFMKFYAWGPFEIVGKLTPDGIAFIEGSLEKNSPPIEFLVYRNATVAK
jgi:hypothetical protein